MIGAPLVFDVKRGSLDDGPGIRSVVFLKGCPLRCVWCHNPESYKAEQEIFFDAAKCIGCGSCKKVCEKHAFSLREEKMLDRNLCDRCGNCARVCPTNALKQVGRYYTEDELFSLLLEDKIYYGESGGGVTFSGGEPLIYPDYVGGLAKKLAASGISVAVETCGYFDWEQVSELVMPYVTEVLFDIKLFDNTQHRKYTGADNGIILENLRRLATFPKIHITPRTPLIPGITDTPENLRAIQGFLRELNLENRYQTLAFHDGGAKKREKLDMPKWVLPTIETIYNTLA